MIIGYHRPQSIKDALTLLSEPDTFPLGGGTSLIQQREKEFSVVDLQALGFDELETNSDMIVIGATVTLQKLLEYPDSPYAMKKALALEAPLNVRNVATVAGTLVMCDGRSLLGIVLLALDANIFFANDDEKPMRLGNLFALRDELLRGKLIRKIEISREVSLSCEAIARTPLDKPIVSAALCQWQSGRTRLALGGWGKLPLLVLDGTDTGGVFEAARDVATNASDEWASAEYRMEMAGVLAKRCLALST